MRSNTQRCGSAALSNAWRGGITPPCPPRMPQCRADTQVFYHYVTNWSEGILMKCPSSKIIDHSTDIHLVIRQVWQRHQDISAGVEGIYYLIIIIVVMNLVRFPNSFGLHKTMMKPTTTIIFVLVSVMPVEMERVAEIVWIARAVAAAVQKGDPSSPSCPGLK